MRRTIVLVVVAAAAAATACTPLPTAAQLGAAFPGNAVDVDNVHFDAIDGGIRASGSCRRGGVIVSSFLNEEKLRFGAGPAAQLAAGDLNLACITRRADDAKRDLDLWNAEHPGPRPH